MWPFTKRQQNIVSSKTSPELEKLQIQLTDLALNIAENCKIKLDFSLNSIQQVEEILNELHAQYEMTKSDVGIRGMALEFAAYIITVIEKNLTPGEWKRNSPEMGPDTFPYYLTEGRVIFPYAWCLKRILDGQEGNVWSKFQALVLDKED